MPWHDNPFLDQGLASTTLTPLGMRVKSARGPWLQMDDDRQIFDAISGIGVSNFGHHHPLIQKSLQNQLDRHLHVMVYGEFLQEVQELASKSLLATMPESLDCVYFVNSGAEAIDAALKLAKRVTGRTELIGVRGGYHGNTHGALSVSSNETRKARYRPLLPDVGMLEWNDEDSLDRITQRTACVVVESIQGDAGVRIPDTSWMKALRRRCTEQGALLIADEIQCGMGRSGKTWAFEHLGIIPDVVCMGKALGGGMPIGALAASRDTMATLAYAPSLGHITTFGGHPMACAGVYGAFQALSALDLSAQESRMAAWQTRLERHPLVHVVRRQGSFFAVELDGPDRVAAVVQQGLKGVPSSPEKGILLFWFLSVPHAFRIAPPLTLRDDESEEGLTLLIQTLDAVRSA